MDPDMDITPSDYGEPWTRVKTDTQTDITLRDGTSFRGRADLVDKAQDRTVICVNALAGLTDQLAAEVQKAAENRHDPFRVMLYHLIARRNDAKTMMGLHDWIEENLSIPESDFVSTTLYGLRVTLFEHTQVSLDTWRHLQMPNEVTNRLWRYGMARKPGETQPKITYCLAELRQFYDRPDTLMAIPKIGPVYTKLFMIWMEKFGFAPREASKEA